jgi:HEAT repeat protein
MSDYSLEETIWQLQKSQKADERIFAAFRLGRDRDPRVVTPLIAALRDPDAGVRARAAEALGTREEAHVVSALLMCLDDEDIEVRRVTIQSLGRIGQESALEALLTLLDDDDATLRAQTAEALGNLPMHLTAQALVHAFIHDPETQVQTAAKQSIAHAGNLDAVHALLAYLPQAENDAPLLIDILEVLGTIGEREGREQISTFQQHTDEGVRAMAAWTLSKIG